MANNFGADANCKAWWQFEPGDGFLIDTMGNNPITFADDNVHVDELVHREGTGAAAFDGIWDALRRT